MIQAVLLLFAAILLTSSRALPSEYENARALLPDKHVQAEVIQPGHLKYYYIEAEHLVANKSYEVRVSYPGTMSAAFSLQWARLDGVSQHRQMRRLLNTEKLVFWTGPNSEILGASQPVEGRYYLIVSAERDSPSYDRKIMQKPILYNIVLESLLYGAPYDSIKLVVLGLSSILFAWFVLLVHILPRVSIFAPLFEKSPSEQIVIKQRSMSESLEADSQELIPTADRSLSQKLD
eukprot:GILJ01009721.1.p1 GENE.GILJ01009721.1~~GILJ01009721.1.p1  ORF type:complete len:234 (+),score=26.31 GILJ01009721.1:142-843(+)